MSFLLYGATGYTGALLAEAAAAAGLRPTLGGRSVASLQPLADRLGLPFHVAALDDTAALDAALDGHACVLHCAGPFSQTARPMVDACLRRQVHYLDITGEIPVFTALQARDGEARARGVMLCPGVGFDVVPSDCLAAHLKRRLPSATTLSLSISALGSVSHGTAATAVEILASGGLVRRSGALVPDRLGGEVRVVDVGDGRERFAVRIPWGDLATAWHSTGIPNIEVWFTVPRRVVRVLPFLARLAPALRSSAVRRFLQRRIPSGGPSTRARAAGRSLLRGVVTDATGASRASRLTTPDGYTHTVDVALLCVRRVLAGAVTPGYQTPSSAWGPDLVLEAPGTTRVDDP